MNEQATAPEVQEQPLGVPETPATGEAQSAPVSAPVPAEPRSVGVVANAQPSGPKGFEQATTEDYVLPRVELLQPTSPTVIDGKGTIGSLINNLSKEPLKSNVIIPVFLKKNFIRWIPLDQGGGILYRSSDPQDPRVVAETKWDGMTKPLCTAYLNFLCLVEGEDTPIMVSFHDTGYQAGRDLLTIARLTRKDMFRTRYELTSVKVEGDKGIYFKFKVRKLGPASEEQAQLAELMYEEFFAKDLKFTDERDEQPLDIKGETTQEF